MTVRQGDITLSFLLGLASGRAYVSDALIKEGATAQSAGFMSNKMLAPLTAVKRRLSATTGISAAHLGRRMSPLVRPGS